MNSRRLKLNLRFFKNKQNKKGKMHCKMKPGLIKVGVQEGKNSCRECFLCLVSFN